MKHLPATFNKSLALTFVLLAMLSACNSKRLENTKELSKEIKASQIKRVTNTQLVYTVDEWGKKISKIAEKALEKELKANPEKASELCKDLSKIPLVAAMQKEYGVLIQLLGAADVKNPALNPKERELMEAYLYSAKAKAAASDNVQQLNDTLLVYNVPVLAENPVCKTCMAGQEIPFAVWRLLFDKKEIIRKLDAKMLKE
ncbi:hypothetical protein [Dyadobacter psychrotolerans]|uniref:DUF3365 domain-containing protein n=1 Tax=Dyadobacter psychrotolerans TaxID=2541721 RepID=A0A4R5DRJ0_9BACT|nr:hypothetical protein [Dyadobacter psychrotolerans]TDE13685.1 hypothetical protein E0F88_17445 [Dyadobacter psychrotolerans]